MRQGEDTRSKKNCVPLRFSPPLFYHKFHRLLTDWQATLLSSRKYPVIASMRKTVFVPLTDDLLYEYPERILGPVIPFSQQARRAAVEPPARHPGSS